MSKTNQLIKLLEQRSYNNENPYPFVAGYLSAVLERFEKEYKSAEVILNEEIDRVNDLLQKEVA